MSKAPIVFLIFNRPEHTKRSFAAIRSQRPSTLLIIADGPRAGNEADVAKCAEVRRIVSGVDWPCEVFHEYSDKNLGCRLRVSSGITWAFTKVERAIILEDDCIPNTDFFEFCNTLLEFYENNSKVWVITGNNFQNGIKHGDAAYYFSNYNHCWGWATWRRAWQYYDVSIPFWPDWARTNDWKTKFATNEERRAWKKIFDQVKLGTIDTWDYQWTATVWLHNGLTATPNANLVSNIGFGQDATHTTVSSQLDSLPTQPLGKLIHPQTIAVNQAADKYVFNLIFRGPSIAIKIVHRLRIYSKQLLSIFK